MNKNSLTLSNSNRNRVLNYFVFFLLCFFNSMPAFAEELSATDWRTELQQIDTELQGLEDEKTGYLSTARRLEDKGMSWQSQDQTQEAKRAFQKADDYRQAADMLQPRIDALKARKAQILQEHPG